MSLDKLANDLENLIAGTYPKIENASKTYSFDQVTKTLTVYSNKGVRDYCADSNYIPLVTFNCPVIIAESVTDCQSMFDGCKSFNQPLTVPSSVISTEEMFCGCCSLNQQVDFITPGTVPGDMYYKSSTMYVNGIPRFYQSTSSTTDSAEGRTDVFSYMHYLDDIDEE